jgi:hypothetical protein
MAFALVQDTHVFGLGCQGAVRVVLIVSLVGFMYIPPEEKYWRELDRRHRQSA